MAEKDLSSNSDESDEDYSPEGENEGSLSEDSGGSDHEDKQVSDEEEGATKKKRRKLTKTPIKDKQDKPAEEKKPIDIDSLWSEFKEDVKQSESKKEMDQEPVKKPAAAELGKPKSEFLAKGSTRIPKSGGLASVLNKIGKKDKLSTLEKSQLDWKKFKEAEGIDEEIKTHNKGRDGYLEKQDFLERTDLRQFEIEKQLRATKRTFR